MNSTAKILSASVVSALLIASCTKIDESPGGWVAASGGIPAEYGRLVSVTPVNERRFQAVLWFEQADQTVVGVRVNVSRGEVGPLVISFPREQ